MEHVSDELKTAVGGTCCVIDLDDCLNFQAKQRQTAAKVCVQKKEDIVSLLFTLMTFNIGASKMSVSSELQILVLNMSRLSRFCYTLSLLRYCADQT